MAMQARQDWSTGMLELQPHKGAKKGKAIHIDLKDGKHESLDLETSVDEFSSSDYSTSEEESTITDESDSSQAEIMGVVLTNPTMVSSINVPQVEEGKLAKMLAKDLTQEERQAYLAMLEGYRKLFIDGYDQITRVSVVQHHINLKDGAKPVVQRLRRLGVIQQDALLSEVRKLLNACFIYPVEDSEWVSPVVVTPKKNGKWRVCVDYKPLNAATKRDHFPLPFQDEILNEVAGYERYTVCDGYSGYFQIRIAAEDQKKTTFVTPWRCFAYRGMPFGLTNAPATFQRFVTHVFQPFFGKSIRVFIDDFFIYSSRALHLEKVNEGLARLQSFGGQLNVDKCHIAENQVTLLGHVVSSRGIEADPGKVQALVSLPSPKSAKELVSFIQKVRYLSRFIHLLSQVVLPLQQLAHSNTFSWSEENEQQFNEIKELLSSLPTIAPPRWEETFYVNPSVGSDSIGAMLMQNDGETSFMRPIYFVSRVMTPLEKDYTVIEQMVMALMFAVGRFRSYLLPNKFVILTVEDTFPLVLQHMDVSARISKWSVRLQEFEYTVQVERSTQASLAGMLTHRCYERKVKVKAPRPEPVEVQAKLSGAHSLYFDGAYKRKVDKESVGISIQDEDGQKVFGKGLLVENTHSNNEAEYAALALGLEWCVNMDIKRLNVFGDALLLIKQVHDEYAIDPDFKDVISTIALGKKEEPFTLQDGYLMHGNRLSITRSLREKVMFESHAPPYAGHRGIQTTMKAIETYFYWPTMKGDIQDYVSKCVICQKTKYDRGKQPGLLQPLPIPDSPWESISMDFIFGLPKSIHGNTGIWTIVDRFSKQAHFIPVKKTIKAHQMATLFISQVFKYHGLPTSIVSDRDPRMTSNFWKGLFENLGTRLNFSSAYHPQTDGQSEIANLTVLDLLKAYVTEVDQRTQWEKYLPLVEYAYNNTIHTSTEKAPFEVIEGRSKSPLLLKVHGKIFAANEYSRDLKESFQKIKEAISITQQKQKAAANKHRRALAFKENDWVFNIKVS
ncbi:hypothetical protein L7F22_057894 [Adiantum nelumboides]|nr:hypothetical protein [Adiantum nelumboides]